MITQTHEALDNWVAYLTIFSILSTFGGGAWAAVRGYANKGWKKAAALEKKELNDKMFALEDDSKTQWRRIDDFKKEYLSKEAHESFRIEVYAAIKNTLEPIGKDINRLDTSINRLTERLDKFFTSEKFT